MKAIKAPKQLKGTSKRNFQCGSIRPREFSSSISVLGFVKQHP